MGEKERAEALLQAAGVSGVKVQEQAETVTMSKAEADALRAGAAPAIPSADVSQVPAQVQAAADRLEASGGIQAGMVTEADLRTMTAQQIAKLPPEAVNQALEGGRS
jgi:folate-dependent tRNA-U54 methylase TrmFO/GidA